jgi:hypothetical protein
VFERRAVRESAIPRGSGRCTLALPSRVDGPIERRAAADCQISRRFMSDRMDFEIVCPNDHEQTVTFRREEFEAELKSGALVFHCNTCEANWPPSHEDIAKIRRELSKNSG